MKRNKGSLAIPLAIVIAGAFIAVAIYFSNPGGGGASASPTNNNPGVVAVLSQEINIRPIGTDDHILGSPSAKVFVVEYSDLECPFCKQFHATMHKIIDTFGKDGSVAWVYRHFPIDSLHKKARNEAQATECAAKLGGNEKFWSFTDRLYEVTTSNDRLDPARLPEIAKEVGLNEKAFNTCLAAGAEAENIEADYQEAVKAGGNGTPFSVIVSSKKFDVKKVKDSIAALSLKYRVPAEYFAVSSDEMKISVSGAMSYEIMEQFVKMVL